MYEQKKDKLSYLERKDKKEVLYKLNLHHNYNEDKYN